MIETKSFVCADSYKKYRGSIETYKFLSKIDQLHQLEGSQDNRLESFEQRQAILAKHRKRLSEQENRNEMALSAGQAYKDSIDESSALSFKFKVGSKVIDFVGEAAGTIGDANPYAKGVQLFTKAASDAISLYDEKRAKNAEASAHQKFSRASTALIKEDIRNGNISQEDFQKMSTNERKEYLTDLIERPRINGTSTKNWTSGQREVYLNEMLRETDRNQSIFQRQNEILFEDVNDGIDALWDQFFDAHGKSEENFRALKTQMKKTTKGLKGIQLGQENTINGLSLVNEGLLNNAGLTIQNGLDVGEIKSDVFFIKMYTMGNMSATQLLKHHRDGVPFLDNVIGKKELSKEEFQTKKDEYLDNLKTLSELEKVEADVTKITQYASNFSELATNLGFKGADKINMAVNLLNSSANIFIGLSSPVINPLSILNGVTGLSRMFTGPQKSPAALRHEQIMEGLQHLMEGQQAIMNNISQLGELVAEGFAELSNQMTRQIQQVVQNQKMIVERIYDLDETIKSNYINVMYKLDNIYYSTLTNREILSYIVTKDSSSCFNFSSQMIKRGPYNNFDDFEYWFYENSSYLRRCVKGLATAFSYERNNGPVSQMFRYSWHINRSDRGETDQFFHEVYGNTINFIFENMSKLKIQDIDLLKSAFLPLSNLADLKSKKDSLDTARIPRDFFGFRTTFHKRDLLTGLLHPREVYNQVEHLLDVQGYLELIDFGSEDLNLKSYEQLVGGRVSSRPRDYLEFALKIIDTSIAQLNILSGDLGVLMMDKVFDQRFKKGNKEDLGNREFKKALDVLYYNRLFANNFLTYRLKKELKVKGYNFLSLSLALSQGDAQLLREITSSPWKFVKGDDGKWKVQLYRLEKGKTKAVFFTLDLPTPQMIESQKIQYKSDLMMLKKLRLRVQKAIINFDLPKKLKNKDKDSFMSLIYLMH
jgi:hypothetical protein